LFDPSAIRRRRRLLYRFAEERDKAVMRHEANAGEREGFAPRTFIFTDPQA